MADELTIQRKLTKSFIDTQPVSIVLTPRSLEKQSTGGKKWVEDTPRSPQTLRLIEPSSSGPDPVRTADGIEREVEFILLGEHDAIIGQNDIFEYGGLSWEVVQLMHFNGWERRATVCRFG